MRQVNATLQSGIRLILSAPLTFGNFVREGGSLARFWLQGGRLQDFWSLAPENGAKGAVSANFRNFSENLLFESEMNSKNLICRVEGVFGKVF